MNFPTPDSLVQQWRSASAAGGWLHPEDWHQPAVEAMVHAFTARRDVEAAAAELGAARAVSGVGLAEALDDLAAFFAVASASPPFATTRAFAERWSEVATTAILSCGTRDALTGLATVDYLSARMREIYAEQRATGIPVSTSWCFVWVGPTAKEAAAQKGARAEAAAQGWRSVTQRSILARVIFEVFDSGQNNAVLASGTFLSLARAESLAEPAARLRYRISQYEELREIAVRIDPAPNGLDEALKLIAAN